MKLDQLIEYNNKIVKNYAENEAGVFYKKA